MAPRALPAAPVNISAVVLKSRFSIIFSNINLNVYYFRFLLKRTMLVSGEFTFTHFAYLHRYCYLQSYSLHIYLQYLRMLYLHLKIN